jgi:hypothetical protein
MKIQHQYFLYNITKEVGTILRKNGITIEYKQFQDVCIDESSEKNAFFVDTMNTHNMKWSDKGTFKLYDRTDIAESECAILNICFTEFWGYIMPDERITNPSFDPESICTKCGGYAKQIKPFYMSYNKMRSFKNIIRRPMNYDTLLVGSELKSRMESEAFTGFEFLPILKRNGDAIPDVYQIYTTSILPALLPRESYVSLIETNEPIRVCPMCGRLRAYGIKGNYVYPKEIIPYIKDINLTGERLAYGTGRHIISRRFALFLLDNKIKLRWQLIPVFIN